VVLSKRKGIYHAQCAGGRVPLISKGKQISAPSLRGRGEPKIAVSRKKQTKEKRDKNVEMTNTTKKEPARTNQKSPCPEARPKLNGQDLHALENA